MATNTKSKSAKGKPVKKERWWVLSAWLILMMIHGAFQALVVYPYLKSQYSHQTTIILPILLLVSLGHIVAAVALWFWKKWGLYLYVAAVIVAIAVHLVLTGSGLVAFYDAIPLLIFGYLINQKSQINYFE